MRMFFSVIAGSLMAIGLFPYILSILCGKTKPIKSSWIIWAVLDTITFAGMYVGKTLNSQIAVAVVCVWVVVILSFKYGLPGWTKLDVFSILGAVIGISAWVIYKDPLFGVAISSFVNFIGSFPTFVSVWNNPKNESRLAWTIIWSSCIFTLLSISEFSMMSLFQPITFLVIETIMMYLLWWRPWNLIKNQERFGV